MVWRGSSTIKDRIFAGLVYLFPIMEVLLFGSFLFALIPPLRLLFSPLFFLLPIYLYPIGGMQLIPLVIFFALFVGVARKETLNHLLRFNTMQALLLAIFAYLCEIFLRLFGYSGELLFSGFASGTDLTSILVRGGGMLVGAIIFSAIFIVVVGASVYAIVQSLRGKYAEMPLISESAYSQVR